MGGAAGAVLGWAGRAWHLVRDCGADGPVGGAIGRRKSIDLSAA